MQSGCEQKISLSKSKQEQLAAYRGQIFDKIDAFFDEVVKRAGERRERLKTEYKQIESKEKRRLKSKQMKVERDLQGLRAFAGDFAEFFADFDSEMDHLANKASLDGQMQELQCLERELKKGSSFFKSSLFKFPSFSFLPSDLELVDSLGRVTNNADFPMPIVAFNTHTLQVFNYRESQRDFRELKFLDEDQLA